MPSIAWQDLRQFFGSLRLQEIYDPVDGSLYK